MKQNRPTIRPAATAATAIAPDAVTTLRNIIPFPGRLANASRPVGTMHPVCLDSLARKSKI